MIAKTILIVAGGKGLRMGGELPKQFLPIGGKPVLMHTVEAFYRYDESIRIIIVLPTEQQEYWKELCLQHQFQIPHQIADGGETRFHSVRNGLELVPDEGLAGVHDGVRPFVSQQVISDCFTAAETYHAVIPVIGVVESLRRMDGKQSFSVERDRFRLVQTPQVFNAALLKMAYRRPYSETFTDDASVVEAYGTPVHLVEGNRENIKITTPFDLQLANVLLECSI